jgi:hypothetical protein
MARSKSSFRQRDITRAIKAARAAGVTDPRIEISVDGKIIIITKESEPGGCVAGRSATPRDGEWDNIQ